MRYSWRLSAARPWQAFLETLVFAALCWSGLLLAHELISFVLAMLLSLLTGIVAMLICALRLRLPGGSWRRQIFVDLLPGLLVALLLSGLEMLFTLRLVDLTRTISLSWHGVHRPLLAALIAFGLDLALFSFFRLSIRFYSLGRQLRRTSLFWSLTYAQVMSAAAGTGLLILLVEGVVIYKSLDSFTSLFTGLGLILLGLFMLLAIVLPFALASYLVVRQMTRRLQMLAAATSTLRAGDYSRRVPVVGEDEVARLQDDFNAMAAELEQTVLALQKERDMVSALLLERRELIATVSHELRTPMATLRSYLESTLLHWNEREQTELRNDLGIMEEEVMRLQRLVDELFALSRAEIGKLTLQIVSTDIGSLVSHVTAVIRPLAWQMGRIEVVSEIAPGLLTAYADVGRLEQVLLNLLHNAVRHTPPGGIVVLAVQNEEDMLALRVSDTGEGIAPEKLSRIWQRFYQGEQPPQLREEGAGLGLALVKEWVEIMGGSVAVESVVGQGSCFTVRLPLADPCLVPDSLYDDMLY
jgi:signal transduction histidine kinase